MRKNITTSLKIMYDFFARSSYVQKANFFIASNISIGLVFFFFSFVVFMLAADS